MTASACTEEEFVKVWNKTGGSASKVAQLLKTNVRNVYSRRRAIEAKTGKKLNGSGGAAVAYDVGPETEELRARVRELEAALKTQKKDGLDEEYVKSKILKLAEQKPTLPGWMIKPHNNTKAPGVPVMMWSDWHWGEVVDPSQIGGVNEFDMTIARQRAKRLVENTIDLLKNHMVCPDYPGVVINLGGDFVSGNIHDELAATNEEQIMPVILDLYGVLIECLTIMADEFGNVFVPCVTGNHGRDTHKIYNKGRNFTNFDWLLYCFLSKHFEKDNRVRFLIPNGPDALYSVYGHRYLLTHGDQFRGGDGVIGALGPIIRGDHRKRSRNGQINMAYDTMILGHWHQLIQLQRLIVNGSLKGYDEYAYANSFGYEVARQALWITHPNHGITFTMPVNVAGKGEVRDQSWVSWKA